jgi:hypothetical protein
LSWVAGSGTAPITYNIYRNTTGNSPVAGDLVSGSPVSGTSYADPTTTGGPYYYWVQTVSGGQVSPDKVAANTNSGGGVLPTVSCGPSLVTSDKDIIDINGSSVTEPTGQPPQACNSGTDPLPAATVLQNGNILTFELNLCNTGTASATSLSVVDTMNNLAMPAGGWAAQYCSGLGACNSITPTVSGSSPDQSLSFTIPGTIGYTGNGSPVWGYIVYQAQLAVPAGTSGVASRFNNQFSVKFTGGTLGPQTVTGSTPWIPFYLGGGGSTINEVP